jgi:hypothetical protein
MESIVEFLQKLWNSVVAPALPVLLVLLGYWLAARDKRISTSYERHTEDLRGLACRWSVQINPIPDAGDLLESKPTLLLLDVEREYLFSDLKNHLPKELPIIEPWEEFKDHLLKYDQKRFHLHQEIIDDAKKTTGLPYDPYSSNSPTIGRSFAGQWYREIYTIASKPEFATHKIQIWMDSARSNNLELMSQGDILVRVREQSEIPAVEGVLREWFSGLPSSPYIEQAKEIIKEREQLERERQALLLMIGDFALIPLVKGKCKYIRWSVLWPW